MKDKSPGMFLMVLFGISGMAILMLAWLWPMPTPDRITALFVGAIGLLMALTRLLRLRHAPVKTDDERVSVEVGKVGPDLY